eukprot:s2782_g3.t1
MAPDGLQLERGFQKAKAALPASAAGQRTARWTRSMALGTREHHQVQFQDDFRLGCQSAAPWTRPFHQRSSSLPLMIFEGVLQTQGELGPGATVQRRADFPQLRKPTEFPPGGSLLS